MVIIPQLTILNNSVISLPKGGTICKCFFCEKPRFFKALPWISSLSPQRFVRDLSLVTQPKGVKGYTKNKNFSTFSIVNFLHRIVLTPFPPKFKHYTTAIPSYYAVFNCSSIYILIPSALVISYFLETPSKYSLIEVLDITT